MMGGSSVQIVDVGGAKYFLVVPVPPVGRQIFDTAGWILFDRPQGDPTAPWSWAKRKRGKEEEKKRERERECVINLNLYIYM